MYVIVCLSSNHWVECDCEPLKNENLKSVNNNKHVSKTTHMVEIKEGKENRVHPLKVCNNEGIVVDTSRIVQLLFSHVNIHLLSCSFFHFHSLRHYRELWMCLGSLLGPIIWATTLRTVQNSQQYYTRVSFCVNQMVINVNHYNMQCLFLFQIFI